MGAGSTFAQGANTNTANPYAGTTSPYFGAAQAQSLANLTGAQQAYQQALGARQQQIGEAQTLRSP